MATFNDKFMESFALPNKILTFVGMPLFVKNNTITPFEHVVLAVRYSVIIICLIVAVILFIGYILITTTFNLLDVTKVLPCMCYCIIGLTKLQAFRVNVEGVRDVLIDLNRIFPSEEKNDDAVHIVDVILTNLNKSVTIIAITSAVFISSWNLSSLIIMIIEYLSTGTAEKILPYYLYMPFDTKGTFTYPIAYLFNILLGSVACIASVGMDTLFLTIATHICMHFKLLQSQFEQNIQADVSPNEENELTILKTYQEMIYKRLQNLVKTHSELIGSCQSVEDIFNEAIFVNLICSSVLICSAAFQATVLLDFQIVIFTMFLVTYLTQTIILANVGQNLIDESNAIGDAVYNSPWYLTDRKYCRMVFFIILRAQRPEMFTALRFTGISIRTCSSIMSSAYSYFAVLNTFYRK